MHPGHPLAGQTLPVVRRYREQNERLWVIELPDGSRQYVPASWCAPLVSPSTRVVAEELPVASHASGQSGSGGSPLSLAAPRELAALVRRLGERGVAREEEHADDAATQPGRGAARPRDDTSAPATNRLLRRDDLRTWESFPLPERRLLVSALVQTARRQIPTPGPTRPAATRR